MSTIRTQFGPVTNFSVSLNGLATGAARSSAKVENQNSRYIDAICQFKIKPASGSLGDRYAVYFFAWGATDDTSPIFPAGVTGVDEAVSLTLETAWNTEHSNPEGYRRLGEQLGQAIARYLRDKPSKQAR